MRAATSLSNSRTFQGLSRSKKAIFKHLTHDKNKQTYSVITDRCCGCRCSGIASMFLTRTWPRWWCRGGTRRWLRWFRFSSACRRSTETWHCHVCALCLSEALKLMLMLLSFSMTSQSRLTHTWNVKLWLTHPALRMSNVLSLRKAGFRICKKRGQSAGKEGPSS